MLTDAVCTSSMSGLIALCGTASSASRDVVVRVSVLNVLDVEDRINGIHMLEQCVFSQQLNGRFAERQRS